MSKDEVIADGYSVFFGNASFGSLRAFLKNTSFSGYIVLTDTNTKKHCLPVLLAKVPELKTASIITVKAGELHKNLATCSVIWDALTQAKADRNTLLINLGGGVVSDMGGFCASVFKRGIPFIHLPTTSLSMADASVGGKTGIDYHSFKNHIGTFCNPLAVFIYSDFCKTQSKREFTNGLAEVVKAGFIADKELAAATSKNPGNFDALIKRSVDIKNTIVLKDPKEKGLRKILNFGHTIGHALESFYLHKKGKQLLHGEAIAIGMICESRIAVSLGLMQEKEFVFIQTCIRSLFKKVKLDAKDFPAIILLMQQDKKNKAGAIQLALIEKPGKHLLDVECSNSALTEALTYYLLNC